MDAGDRRRGVGGSRRGGGGRPLLALALALAAPFGGAPAAAACPEASPVSAFRAVAGGRHELTRAICFETEALGTVVLTRGFRSDGASGPVPDMPATRRAGFLHDALYAASGHLRFPDGARRWSRREADAAFCETLRADAPGWRARALCAGTRLAPVERRWRALAPKRERRWRQWGL